jgi:transposase
MFSVPGNAPIFLFQSVVDMRKGFEGLAALVMEGFGLEVTSGGYFVFLNRRRDRMKVLYWDIDGLAYWYKRLERGSFPKHCDGQAQVDRRRFLMMLEGVIPKRIQKRFCLG